ncbi:MAG: hypothetical protein O3B01_25730 [Planctomycetota bacterium]|nr:hypothetical protein [Planctomycetota bacterium]
MDADIHLKKILAHARRRIRLIDMAKGGLALVIFTFGFFFAEVLLDHFIILRRPHRVVLLALYQVTAISLVLWVVLRPVFRRISRLYIARRIEQNHPELKNRLITYLQLDNETSALIRNDISSNLSRKLEGFTVSGVFSFKALKPFAAAFIGLSLLIYGYAILSPKSIIVSLKRAIYPTQQILPPTLTKITRVEPGDADILKGNPIQFWAKTDGNPPKKADLVYSLDDGTSWESMPMSVSNNGILKTNKEAPGSTMRYYLTAGDTRSERYVITVVNPAALTSIRGELTFPAYTGLTNREFQGGTVKAIEGSRAVIKAEANVAVTLAQVLLGNLEEPVAARITDSKKITFDLAVDSNDIYSVQLTSTQGYKEPYPARHRIIALKDKPPEVRAIQPAQDVELAENESLELIFRMRDDFGISAVSLRLKSRFEEERILPLVVPGLAREKTANVRLTIKSLGLSAGDEATYSILVHDNKPDEPNAGESQTFGLRVLNSRPVQLALNAPEESEPSEESDNTEEGKAHDDPEGQKSQADSENLADREVRPGAEKSNESDASDPEKHSEGEDEAAVESNVSQPLETNKGDPQRAGPTEPLPEKKQQESEHSSDSEEGSARGTEGDASAGHDAPAPENPDTVDQNSDQPQQEVNDKNTEDAKAQPGQGESTQGDLPGQQRPGQQAGNQPGQQAESPPGNQQGQRTGLQPGSKPGEQAGAQSENQPGQQAGSQPGSRPGEQAGAQPENQPGQQAGSQPGSRPGEQAGAQPGNQSGQQAGSQPGSRPGEQAGAQPGQQAGAQPGSQPGQQAGAPSQEGNGGSGSPQASGTNSSQPNQTEAQIARSSQAGEARNAAENIGTATPKIDPDVFRQDRDGLPLGIPPGGEDPLSDLNEFAALDETRLVELGFSESAARHFTKNLQELKLKEKRGEKDEELQKHLREMALSIASIKQKMLRSESVAEDVSGRSVEAKYKTDESVVVEAQLKSLPPQYREMVEEYFRSISSRRKDGE